MEFKDTPKAKNHLIKIVELLQSEPRAYMSGKIGGKQYRAQCMGVIGLVVSGDFNLNSNEDVYVEWGSKTGIGSNNAWFIQREADRLYNKHYPNDGKTWGNIPPEERELEYQRRTQCFIPEICTFLLDIAEKGYVKAPFPYSGLRENGKRLYPDV